MATIQLYLIPRFSRTFFNFGEGSMYEVGTMLRDYFNTICSGVRGFDGSDFHWEGDASAVTDTDLVCYVLADRSRSIVRRHSSDPLGPGGSTVWSTRSHAMISEVYLASADGDRSRSRLLANLILHEWMHNKLDAHPSRAVLRDVHSIRGGTVSHLPVNSSMRPSAADVRAMRRGIPLHISQYTRSF